jgi:hypothetical protein
MNSNNNNNKKRKLDGGEKRDREVECQKSPQCSPAATAKKK